MTTFSFTVTLKPCMYRYEPEEQYDLTYKELVLLLRKMTNNYTLIAELTNVMNLHFHGIIELHHKKKWYSSFRNNKMFGFTTCREIHNMEGWKEYITKSFQETYECINRRPIIHDDFEITTSETKLKFSIEF